MYVFTRIILQLAWLVSFRASELISSQWAALVQWNIRLIQSYCFFGSTSLDLAYLNIEMTVWYRHLVKTRCRNKNYRRITGSVFRSEVGSPRVIQSFSLSPRWNILKGKLQRLPPTRAFEGFFSVCLNLSFRGHQSTVSMVFHALWQRRFPHRWMKGE